MGTKLFIDNWTLFDINECFKDGLSPYKGDSISIDKRSGKHEWVKVHHANVQLDALFSILAQIVFADKLFVDEDYSSE